MKIKGLKVSTTILQNLAKVVYVFNKKIKGITTLYSHKYVRKGSQQQTLDIMYDKTRSNLPCVIYLHGGGWMTFDKNVIRTTCKRMSSMGTVVFNCNYRLAPKFKIEDMEQDMFSIMDYVIKNAHKYGGNPNKIIFAGDSAGAHLGSLLVSKLACGKYEDNSYYSRIAGMVLFYGVFNMRTVVNTGFPYIKQYVKSVLPKNISNPSYYLTTISPTHYVHPSLPPVFMASGAIDKLHKSQSLHYLHKLKQSGIDVTHVFFTESDKSAQHRFINFDGNSANITSLYHLSHYFAKIQKST